MIADIIAIVLALSVFAYVIFSIGKKKGLKEGFFKDENDNDIPDFVEKKKTTKGSKSKKKK